MTPETKNAARTSRRNTQPSYSVRVRASVRAPQSGTLRRDGDDGEQRQVRGGWGESAGALFTGSVRVEDPPGVGLVSFSRATEARKSWRKTHRAVGTSLLRSAQEHDA